MTRGQGKIGLVTGQYQGRVASKAGQGGIKGRTGWHGRSGQGGMDGRAGWQGRQGTVVCKAGQGGIEVRAGWYVRAGKDSAGQGCVAGQGRPVGWATMP